MKKVTFLTSILAFILLGGCQIKPTKVYRFLGPYPEIYYTVEVWEDGGAMSTDFTRVFANLTRDRITDKQLVVDGPYISISKIQWISRNAVRLCLSAGRVNSFKEETLLNAAGTHYKLKNELDHNCITTAQSTSRNGLQGNNTGRNGVRLGPLLI